MKYFLLTSTVLMFIFPYNSIGQNKKKLIKEGNKLYNDSSYNMAEMKYRKSLEKDQNYFNAAFNLADAVYKQERYGEASSFFESLKDNARNDLDLAHINHNLGNSLLKEGKLNEAIDAYKNSLRLNSNDDDTRYNLAYAQKMKQQQEQQQNKNQDKEQDKEQNKNQDKEQDREQDKEERQNQQEQNNDKDKNPQEKDEMSKEDAEKMLEALLQKEKELQEKLQKKKVKGQKIKILKDW